MVATILADGEPFALADGGRLVLHHRWVPDADALFATLHAEIPWRQESIRIGGKSVLQPRLTAWVGDPETAYTYSGLRLEPSEWPSAASALRRRLEAELGAPFNSVLLNLYRDGQDAVGFHADREKELGPDPLIASLSIGATRRFVLKHAKRRDVAPLSLDLPSGSLLVMGGTLQRFWRHALVRTRSPVGPRINLTFRHIEPRTR